MSHHYLPVSGLLSGASGLLLLCILINFLFVGLEVIVANFSGSMGLLSDAGHNLSDVLGIALAWFGIYLERRHQYVATYVIGIVNCLLLLVAVVVIVFESVERLFHPIAVDGEAVMLTAGVGILIKGLTAWILLRGEQGNVNMRAAFLHAAADVLISAGVVVSGGVVLLTGWSGVDVYVSLLVSVIIFLPIWRLLRKSFSLWLRQEDRNESQGKTVAK